MNGCKRPAKGASGVRTGDERHKFEAEMRAFIEKNPEQWPMLEGCDGEPEAAWTGWQLARAHGVDSTRDDQPKGGAWCHIPVEACTKWATTTRSLLAQRTSTVACRNTRSIPVAFAARRMANITTSDRPCWRTTTASIYATASWCTSTNWTSHGIAGSANRLRSCPRYARAMTAITYCLLAWPAIPKRLAEHSTMSNKRAPVQGYAPGIPWEIHLEAYAAYSKMWAPQPALIDLEGRNCRGGFSTDELDVFVPGWRARVEQFGQMRGALLWLLWHHQGASSIVGLACRRGLGMGQYDHLTDEQVQAAKQWDADGVEGQKR